MPGEQEFMLRAMEARDLDVVLEWRNHPDVRRFMITQHLIQPREHQAWFERCRGEARRRLYILQQGEMRLGFAQLGGVARGGVAEWGFYVSPAAPRGTGSELGRRVLQAAFDVEGLHKVCGQSLQSNERSRRLHLRLGFVEEGRLREHLWIGGEYRDVACYGILARDFPGTTP
jgi:UDP-4-amino-4,6-dideoxy-N-acetyl-beta-L-altrosamine N-acetyltransferase